MTRVIAGTWGGRRLATPSGSGTRPTSDRVREAMFSSLESGFGGFGESSLIASANPASNGASCRNEKAYLTFEASSGSSNCARTINAAILSNNHSFEVHNYDAGIFIGYLCVTGSIAQEFRGPVGQGSGSSGFLKRYSYDTRLLNSPPPKFPTPRTTSYDVNTEIEVKTAFDANGAPLP